MKANLLNQNELIQTQIYQSASSSETTEPVTTDPGANPLMLPFFVSVMVGTIAIYLIKKVSKKTEDADINPGLSKVRCPRCHFFSSNSYLRCAVRPDITMTKDAVDCSDYTPRIK